MLLYLLSSDELREILDRPDYHFAPGQIPKMVDYYIARTSHGSTLIGVVHAWVLARANRDHAMECFQQVLKSDVAGIQDGTTSDGIHLAAMAGSVDLVRRCFTGQRPVAIVLCCHRTGRNHSVHWAQGIGDGPSAHTTTPPVVAGDPASLSHTMQASPDHRAISRP